VAKESRPAMSIVEKIFEVSERAVLIVIAVLTVVAIFQEVQTILLSGTVKLADLLLLFLYLEVIGMVAAFYRHRRIPISIPIYITITALCRMIILEGKAMESLELLAESGAIVLLAMAVFVIRKNRNQSSEENLD
jgi:protein PsiE